MKIHPTLNSLKQKLNIQKINTGKQFNYRGIVSDDIERLHSLIGLDDTVHLRSGTEMSSVSYRGQIENFGSCVSTLDRCNTQKEQIVALFRTIAFEELLGEHPFVTVSKQNHFMGTPLHIDYTGIAQHYGLHTNYLDITANFDVACFFATCKWDPSLKKYLPLGYTNKAGVIYRIYDFVMNPFMNQNNQKESFSYLGWQPLPRPEQQRANVIKLAKGQDFDTISSVKKFYFKHSISSSRRIYKMFDEGKILFPEDSGANLANQCENLLEFTDEQINKAFKRYENWSATKLNDDYKKETIKQLEIQIVKKSSLSWDGFLDTDLNNWETKLLEVFSKVGVRITSKHSIQS